MRISAHYLFFDDGFYRLRYELEIFGLLGDASLRFYVSISRMLDISLIWKEIAAEEKIYKKTLGKTFSNSINNPA